MKKIVSAILVIMLGIISFSGCIDEETPVEQDYYLTFSSTGEYAESDAGIPWGGAFSISFLFKLYNKPFTSNQDYMIAFFEPAGTGNIYGWELGFKDCQVGQACQRWYYRDGPDVPRCEKTGWNYPYAYDTWYRITYVVSPSGEGDMKLYRNTTIIIDEGTDPCNEEVGGQTIWDLVLINPFPSIPLVIGQSGSIHGDAVNCSIDDVRVYNRALSLLEVATLCSGNDISDGLILYWDCNEGEGTVLHDTSGNNRHATVYSPDWRVK